MSKVTKIWLIIATFLILIGFIIFVSVMNELKWNFTKLSTEKYETNNYVISEYYKNISIKNDTSDVIIIPSDTLTSSVVCYEQKNVKHTVEVKDDTLIIEVIDTRKWYEYIGISLDTPKITIYIPKGEYEILSVKSSTGDIDISDNFNFKNIDITASTGDVKNNASVSENIKIKTSTGDINIRNIFADTIELSVSTGIITISDVTCEEDVKINVSTGKTNISNIRCKNIISRGSTGKIFLNNVIATEKFSIERDTGDINFDSCDASEIFIKTSTGDVKGSLLTDKVFIVQTDTGNVNIPKTTTGSKCEINTDTGDIKISITN